MQLFEEVLQHKGFWALQGPQSHVALSSRVRLARNIHDMSFPLKIDRNELLSLRAFIERFVAESSYKEKLSVVDINAIGSYDKRLLRERNIITNEMELSDSCYVVIGQDEEFSILINEEDHIRIQVIRSGLQLFDTYSIADKIDDELNRFLSYAFSEEYGFLTSCITNTGTGLRVSVLMHLPMLTKKNTIGEISESFQKRGVEIKRTIPKSSGSIYQVSNRISLGLSEVDILETIDEVASEIIEMEDSERDTNYLENRSDIEDRIWRSFGLLQFSKKMTYIEAVEHLSNIRLGIILAVIKSIELHEINDILVNIQWSHLQRKAGRIFVTTAECDEYRSEYLKSVIQ